MDMGGLECTGWILPMSLLDAEKQSWTDWERMTRIAEVIG
jgi:hypothetical protein